MSRKVFRALVSVEEAQEKLRRHFKPQPTGSEILPLERVAGRVLAENVEAPIDIPPFDRAAMDGYAVRAEDTYGTDEGCAKTLRIVGKVAAGEEPKLKVSTGEATEISTGAPIPHEANAVVMVEYTQQENNRVKVYRSVTPGENIMAAGSDIMAGEVILRRGMILTPRETGVLAALGVANIRCFSKPKVAVLSTGNEITTLGEPLEYGKIYDINARTLCDSVVECGCEPVFMGVARDDPMELTSRMTEALKLCDVVLTSGSTSAGLGDLLYKIIDDLGSPGILVHGVAVKPGKPSIIAVVDGKPVFGLPGYATSALVIFDIFVRPLLRQMAGLKTEAERRTVRARVGERVHSVAGRREYMPVSLILTETGEHVVYPVLGKSGAITTLSKADGFVEIPEDRLILDEGEEVQVKLFSSEIRPANFVFIGSHCIGVDVLLDMMLERMPELSPKVVNVGSSGGLLALGRGEADVAGVHLLYPESGEYNVPYLERYGVAGKVALVRGYIRRQGLVVPKRSPRGIKTLDDLLSGEVSIINRNPGSGTRLLLDYLLQRLATARGLDLKQLTSKIKGYSSGAKSHSAVATAVAREKVDVGLAIETVAHRYNLDFIPLADERYDFAIPVSRLSKPTVKLFLEVLRSEDFKSKLLTRHPGLVPTDDTGKIIYMPE